MKRTMLIFLLLVSAFTGLHSQKIEKYFDYGWKPCEPNMARFYARIEYTDSGWLRRDYFLAEKKLQMKGLYKDSATSIGHGRFYFFHPNGILQSTGNYENGKKQGVWFGFYPNGFMRDSTEYDHGNARGTSLQWHNNGFLSDSAVYNEDGSTISVSWFDDGSVSSAGHLNALGKPQGKWQYFHTNGKLSASEAYDNGRLVDRKYFSEAGSPMADTTDRSKSAEFTGGIPAWTKYLGRKIYFPPNYQIINGDKAVVVIEFTVTENGEIADVTLKTPFHKAFDDIALMAVKGAPKWKPAMDHNRRVKISHRQAINFEQVTY